MESLEKQIKRRIHGSGRGSVFMPTRFLDLGNKRRDFTGTNVFAALTAVMRV